MTLGKPAPNPGDGAPDTVPLAFPGQRRVPEPPDPTTPGTVPPQGSRHASGSPLAPGPGQAPEPDPESATAAPRQPRDSSIDALRALALVRVMAYHTFGWAWLPVAFPSMGVMFALGGSLVAASLTASRTNQAQVIRKRLRRLLPPLWLYGAVVVTVMARNGWTVTSTSGTPLTWRAALYWVLPVADPPGSAWGYDLVLPLWYIRTYLWLLLLSPFALWLFRRYPLRTLAVPGLVLAAIAAGLVDVTSATGDTIEHLATFGACWLLGFAHHDGRLRALPRGRTIGGALLVMAAGLAYAVTHQQVGSGWDIDDIDVADALYSAGAVLLLLRLWPQRQLLARTPRLGRLVSAMNARAMTIYLWGNLAIWSATPLLETTELTRRLEVPGVRGQLAQFVAAWIVMVVVVAAVGWAEDVAAGRGPRLNPWPRPRRGRARSQRVPRAALASIAVTLGVVLVVATLQAPAPGNGEHATTAMPAPAPARFYPMHASVPATLFWIGGVVRPNAGPDGQSLTSAWDIRWTEHYGGCDGFGAPGGTCRSDVAARVGPDWFPAVTVPAENPYYVGLPYNDLASPKTTDRARIPWSTDPGYADHLHDRGVSFVKNRWVSVIGPEGTCYAQVEDSGPGKLDPGYVLGTARPRAGYGMNLSPAVFRCVGLPSGAGDGIVSWRFVDSPPAGPWTRVITTRQVR